MLIGYVHFSGDNSDELYKVFSLFLFFKVFISEKNLTTFEMVPKKESILVCKC